MAIQLIGSDGRMVAVPFTRNTNGYQLDIRSLAPGVYVIRVGGETARILKR